MKKLILPKGKRDEYAKSVPALPTEERAKSLAVEVKKGQSQAGHSGSAISDSAKSPGPVNLPALTATAIADAVKRTENKKS